MFQMIEPTPEREAEIMAHVREVIAEHVGVDIFAPVIVTRHLCVSLDQEGYQLAVGRADGFGGLWWQLFELWQCEKHQAWEARQLEPPFMILDDVNAAILTSTEESDDEDQESEG